MLAGALVLAFSSPIFEVYFFTATWCGPCRAVYPVLDKYKNKEPNCLRVTSIDFDTQRDVATQFGVETVPVVIGADGKGRPAFRVDGAGQQELKALDAALDGLVRRCRSGK